MKFELEYTEKYIIDNYNIMLVKDIQEHLKCSYSVIKRVLNKYNIPKKGSGTTNLNSIDLVIPNISEENDYILGLLGSDGCIRYDLKDRVYLVTYASKDDELVQIYKNHFPQVNTFERPDGVVISYFGNRRIVEYLISIGITPRKSFTFN